MNDRSTLIKYHSKSGAGYIKNLENPVTNDDLNDPSSSRNHEKCAVRTCSNTLKDEPFKIFFPFPSNHSLREAWFRACGLDVSSPPKYALYCCEEHFDLKRETNVGVLRQVAGSGGIVHNLLKDRVVPHRQVVANPLWSQPSPGMSGRKTWHEPVSSPSGSTDLCQNGGTDGGHEPSASFAPASGQKIRVKTATELNHVPTAVPAIKQNRRVANRFNCKTSKDSSEPQYKECVVPNCPTNTCTFPDAKFVCGPFALSTRRIWYNAIGRPMPTGSQASMFTEYFCMDHFKPSDLEMFKLPKDDHSIHVRVKHGVVPTLKSGRDSTKENGNPATEILWPAVAASPSVSEVPVVKPVPSSTPPIVANKIIEVTPKKKPENVVRPTFKPYEPKSMPQYPECQPKCPPWFECSRVTALEYTSFYTKFFSLSTRVEQNDFIFSHTELDPDNSFADTPRFKFYVDVKSPPHQTPLARVCAFAFATSLSLDVDVILGLVIQNVERVRDALIPTVTVRLEAVKTEDGADDLMVYNPVPEAYEISSDSEEGSPPIIKLEPTEEYCAKQEIKTEKESPPESRPESPQRPPEPPQLQSPAREPPEPAHRPPSPVGSTITVKDTFESMHLCPRCLAQFNSRKKFEQHEKEQTCKKHSGTYFNCETCGRTYYKFEDLRVHTSIMHKYICPKCSDTFRFRRYLEDHVVSCSGTNELSDRMRILVKNVELKTDVPPKKKSKTDITQSSMNRVPLGRKKNHESRPVSSLLRPAILKLDRLKKYRSNQASSSVPKAASALSEPLLEIEPTHMKKKKFQECDVLDPLAWQSPRKKSVPLVSTGVNSTISRQPPRQQLVPKIVNVQTLLEAQPMSDPVRVPENQVRLPQQYERVPKPKNDRARGLGQPRLTQQLPGAIRSEVKHTNDAQSYENEGVPRGMMTAHSGHKSTPKPQQPHTSPAMNDTLPDFYKLIFATPEPSRKPPEPPRMVRPARQLLRQHPEPRNPSNSQAGALGSSSAQNAASCIGAPSRPKDDFTSDIMSPLNRLIHAHNNAISITIQNPQKQGLPNGRQPGSKDSNSSFPLVQGRLQQEPSRDTVGAILNGLVPNVSRQTLFGQPKAVLIDRPCQGNPNSPYSPTPPPPQPIPSLLDLDILPPRHVNSSLPDFHPSRNPPSKSTGAEQYFMQSKGIITPLFLLRETDNAISNFSDEYVSKAEETAAISRVVLDSERRHRSVGCQTTLPLVATDSRRCRVDPEGDPDNCKRTDTPAFMLKTSDANPIKNFSDECIALFDQAIFVSKALMEEPNRRSVASQTTLPLVANETFLHGNDNSSAKSRPRLPTPVKTCHSKQTSTDPYLVHPNKGKSVQNFSDHYIAFASETIAPECFTATGKRCVASQTTLPLEASRLNIIKKPTRRRRRVTGFFKNERGPNIPLVNQTGWLLKQPKADDIPKHHRLSRPAGFDFENGKHHDKRRRANRMKRKLERDAAKITYGEVPLHFITPSCPAQNVGVSSSAHLNTASPVALPMEIEDPWG